MDNSRKRFILIIVMCWIAMITQVESMQFAIDIRDSQEMCFSHLITQSTPFRFSVEGDNPEYTLQMRFKDETVLVKQDDETSRVKKIDSYAAVTQHYSFCITNPSNKQQFVITFFHGLQLSDISLLPKQQDHKLIDKLVDQLNSLYQSVRSQQFYMKTVNQYNMELQKLVSFKYVGFGFLSITVVLIISFLHYLEIKRVLRTRKVI